MHSSRSGSDKSWEGERIQNVEKRSPAKMPFKRHETNTPKPQNRGDQSGITMNVMHVVESLDPAAGGPARSVPSLGEAIHKTGTNVQLYVNNKEGDAGQGRETKSTFLPIMPIRELGRTVQRSSESQADNLLIHNHGIWLPLNHYACITAKRFSIPLIISPRGMLEPWARSYRSLKKILAWYLYQRRDLRTAAVLHATSEQEAVNLQALGFHLPVAVIANGVDIPIPLEPHRESRGKKTVLFLSRVHPIKGIVNLVRAWAEIRPDDWQVVIAGPDEAGHRAEVEQELERQGLTDTFVFIGSVSDQDKWQLYNSADLFVLPSHSENFGIVIAEALAAGVPVITTRATPWEELEAHNCGWWIDIGVEPLATALKEAITLSAEERRAMGRRGSQLVEQNYSWDTIGKEMVAVYEWVLRGGEVPGCVVTDS